MQASDIVVDGIRMRWLERGQGFPVVLVHGIPTSPLLWRKVAPLVDGARVLAFEMVGYGDSIPEGRAADLSVAAQARYLRAWMRALRLPAAVLVGHDLGGGVVHIAAIEEPSCCAGLVITNGVGYDSWPIPSVKALQRLSGVAERLPNAALKASLRLLLRRGHDDPRVAAESLPLHYAPYARHDGAEALVRQARALHTEDTLAVQHRLPELRGRVPARVVWGAADRFQKLRYGERFARDLDAELIRLEGAKHFVPEDHPEELAAAIRTTVAEAWGVARVASGPREAPPPPPP